MNQVLELHDSQVAIVRFDSAGSSIVFSHAYIHRSEREPGRDPGTGWSQRAELVIGEAAEIDLPRSWPCTIHDGSLELSGVVHDNVIPIPLAHAGSAKLQLNVADGDDNFKSLEIIGYGAQLRLLGEARYIEEYPGAS